MRHAIADMDTWWKPGTGPVGLGGYSDVSVMKRCGDHLLICGTFESIGETPVKSFALFNGTRWSGLPDAPAQVFDACPHPLGGWLLVGPFDHIGHVAVHGAARWDGATWRDEGIGPDFSGDQAWMLPHHLILHGGFESEKDGAHLISDDFFIWNGSGWSAWPVKLTGGSPARSLLLELGDRSLVLAGSFSGLNDHPFKNIAIYRDGAWHALGDGLPWYYALGVVEDGDGGLLAWGQPKERGPSALHWDGSSWLPPAWLPEGWRIVAAIKPQGKGHGPDHGSTDSAPLIVAIAKLSPDENRPIRLLTVSGATARVLADHVTAESLALTESPDGRILLAGRMLSIPGAPLCGMAWWNGAALTEASPTLGSDGVVTSMAATRDGGMILGGRFTRCAGIPASRIVRWSPHGSQDLGGGVITIPPKDRDPEWQDDTEITAVVEAPDGTIIVSGVFNRAGAIAAAGVAQWNGSTWKSLGSQAAGARSLAIVPIRTPAGTSGKSLAEAYQVVAAGRFSEGDTIHHLLLWDGDAWRPLGPDPDDDVCAMAVDGDGSLIMVGFFSTIGDRPFPHVARWDGTQWQPLGRGLNGLASAITPHPEGGWVVCGQFTQAGGRPAKHVARWDGTQWQPMGDGIPGSAIRLTTWKSTIIASDMLPMYDDAKASDTVASGNAIALWLDGRWQPLGTGVQGAYCLAMDRDGVLHVGGSFGSAGGRAAGDWARFDLAGFLSARIAPQK